MPQRTIVQANVETPVLAYGEATKASIHGGWPNPSFEGSFLPLKRTISRDGFDAEWSIPFIARGVRADGDPQILSALGSRPVSVTFVELANPYQSVSRSLKYALLIIGFVFLTFFLLEVNNGKRIHPAQYVLVGIAQVVFYLLLLSLAERIGFNAAYAISSVATVSLISVYANWVFESARQGVRALIAFAMLYGLLYLLLRLEDQALLVGALAAFVAIAVVMYVTRKMDWYRSTASAAQETSLAD